MKKTLLILASIAIAITMNAQVIALHSNTGVQIFKGNSALGDAYAAAQNADTLYLSGHTFSPPPAFDKQLTIFGAGHYMDSTLATGKTFINGNIILSENADGFYLEGVELTGNFSFSTNQAVDYVIIKRCKINGSFSVVGNLTNPSTNLSLIGNVFISSLNIQNAINVFISNNIIAQTIGGTNGNVISNNIILYSNSSSSVYYINGNSNTLENNIFIGYRISNGMGNVYRNNLFVSPTQLYGTTPTTIGNYINIPQANIFVNQTGTTFDYAHDYHLQAPNTYLGTDGSEVGIYGGLFPYKEGAVPLNPHIRVKNIASATDSNGDLNIQIQVAAQED